jgi:heat shock protein HslJ
MKNFLSIVGTLCLLACANTASQKSKPVQPANDTLVTQQPIFTKTSDADFVGSGNNPVKWQVEINFADSIRFITEDGVRLGIALNQCTKTETEQKVTYYNAKNNFTVERYFKPCGNEANVTCSFLNKTFTGCGAYEVNSGLDGTWLLEKYNGKIVLSTSFAQLPEIKLNTKTQTINGNDGCNQFGGTMQVKGKEIVFSNLMATERYCENMELANIIQQKVSNKPLNYFFKQDKLHFYLIDDGMLIFKKKR